MDTFSGTSRWLGARLCLLTFAVLALPAVARSEEPRAGVVTKLIGTATVARTALPEPAPLHFKDDVLLHDRITTGENSAVRVLLGGKATVTARERSVLTITEIPGTATVRLAAGRAAVAVTKDRMKPGEIVEIRTPNAVVAVRGTVVIAEVEPVVDGYRSTITILKGLVDVTKLDSAGRLTGSPVDVKILERVVVTSARPLAAPDKITRQAAESLAAQFSFVPKNGPAASTEALNAQVKEAAIHDAMQTTGGSPTSTSLAGGAPVVNVVTTRVNTVTNPAAPKVPSTGGILSGLGLRN